ncbi:helix-turn-helix domain-containing protein [Paenibacillus sp. KS-LC4]|uniref:GH39 family glycosyl hydrolase n=1 Tax=Paenibacillus sp. KS-LC4 TaxID=2979727 RepID=UPI0030CE4602
MDHTYEIIQTDHELPLHIFFHNVRYVPNHWHDSMELLFVLKGKAIIAVQGKPFVLNEEDIILINSNDIHTIQSEQENLLLALQIPDSFLREQGVDTEQTAFECNSCFHAQGDQQKFIEVRTLLSSIMWNYNKAGYGYEIKVRSLLLELIYLLLRKFRSTQETREYSINRRTMARLLHLNEYIQEHYNRPLTLNELAERENFSVSYLSSFFQKSMGVNFRTYITRIRLEHAVKAMLTTQEPIIKIALDSGFPNLKAFHKAFKAVYQMTPTEYRGHRGQPSSEAELSEPSSDNYLAFDRENAYTSLFKYLPTEANAGAIVAAADQGSIYRFVHIRASGSGRTLKHTWRNLCTIGKAKEALFAPVQQHLRMVQQSIGFQYIRFHGIFDDEMMVARLGPDGKPIFSFGYVDQVVDFFRSIGLRPFFELGFMPGDFADQSKFFFHKKSYMSMPKEMWHWTALLEAFMQHLLNRYGSAEVGSWRFEFWNEPDGGLFWPGTFIQFLELYEASFKAIKQVFPQAQIGGPCVQGDTLVYRGRWMERYLAYCTERKCLPDFLTIHMYPFEYRIEENEDNGEVQMSDFSYAGEDYVAEMLGKVKRKLLELGWTGTELHVTEWNATPHHRELTNDTCFKAAYIAKNIVETFDEISSLGYWTVTDLLEELPLPQETFHGGLGMITNNGIKKAAFYAYELLAKLGSKLLDRGDGYCLTMSKEGTYQLLLFHYAHFDQMYLKNDISAIQPHNRYAVFNHNDQLELSIQLEGLEPGTYRIHQHIINREAGSSYDEWLRMGAPAELMQPDIDYLNQCSVPKQHMCTEIAGDVWTLKFFLAPHEVRLLEFRREWNRA